MRMARRPKLTQEMVDETIKLKVGRAEGIAVRSFFSPYNCW